MATVLIVESEEPLMRRMAWILGEAGIDCAAVKPGPTLREDVLRQQPAVVVLNTELPAQEKENMLGAIHSAAPSARVVDLHSHPGGRRGPRGAPMADMYLHKPFDAESLIDAVQGLLEQNRASAS